VLHDFLLLRLGESVIFLKILLLELNNGYIVEVFRIPTWRAYHKPQ
jgi:hypothetical protein